MSGEIEPAPRVVEGVLCELLPHLREGMQNDQRPGVGYRDPATNAYMTGLAAILGGALARWL